VFNRGDAEAVAGFWAEDAVYDPAAGARLSGSAAIGKAFAEMLSSGKGVQLAVSVETVRPINAAAAMVEGTVAVTPPGGQPQRSRFTSTHVDKDGKWLLHSLSETSLSGASASPVEQLKPLAWMEGVWVDVEEHSHVYYDCAWVAKGRFMRRSFTVVTEDGVERTGTEFVGWDPVANVIRSWSFDSEGAAAEAKWTTKTGAVWNVKTVGTIWGEKGKRSAVHIIKKISDKTYTLQSVGRHDGAGKMLPNSDPVTVVKVR
jgi:uncharacterized protein (TIGR02246 family)